jgi:Asp-tRNA(Asn)/Glu-tRNA(Gln) amidotransferase A subunit family amidase
MPVLTSPASGSGRRPGHWNGYFAMRPSHGYLSPQGLLDSFPRFDMPTFFGRGLEKCKLFAEAWYGNELPSQYFGETVCNPGTPETKADLPSGLTVHCMSLGLHEHDW